MAENPVNPDAGEIGRTYADEPVTLGRAGAGKKRLNAAVIACVVAALLVLLAAFLSFS